MEINALIIISCICMLFIVCKIFIMPIKWFVKLLFNSALGGLLIFLINLIGSNFAFHIGLNIFTALFVGILGTPGAILLMILKLFII